MAKKAESQRIVWWVEHPAHGLAIVQAPNWEQATVEAAKWWDVPWGKVAALCEEKRHEVLPRCICVDCRQPYWGHDGDRVRCAVCENIARNAAAKRKADNKRFWKEMAPRRAR